MASMGMTSAMRRAVDASHPVAVPAPEGSPRRDASEFHSGVLVMAREPRETLAGIYVPLGILVWLGISPVVIPAVTRIRQRRGEHTSQA